MPKVSEYQCSVVVASHRPSGASTLAAYFADHLGKSEVRCEIIFVVDYPVDLIDINHPDIRIVHFPNRSISAKRNAGIKAGTSEIVAFIDDDCIPGEGFVDRGVSYLLRHPAAAGVEGYTEVESGPAGSQIDSQRLKRPGYRTNNIFYRRNALESVGLFDERFAFQREDIDLAFSILETHREIHAAHEIRVLHRFRPGEPFDLLKNCWRRRFDPLLHAKHPRRYRECIGSPITPGIGLMALAWAVSFFLACFSPYVFLLPLSTALILSLRRAVFARSFATLPIETASFLSAPAVIWAALVCGSIRFRHLLLV